jgi:3-methyladenine DNA glycosylase/8-oxoguanine DNA glycosylase
MGRTFRVVGPLDLRRTLGALSRGPGDRTFRVATGRAWYATRTAGGAATVTLVHRGDEVRAEAWGPGAEMALDRVPGLLRLDEPSEPIPVGHPLIRELERRAPGIRIPRSGAVLECLVPAILEQKVTGREAHRAWFGLIRRHGEIAPGPEAWQLRVAPQAATLAALPYYAFHPFGVEQRRA